MGFSIVTINTSCTEKGINTYDLKRKMAILEFTSPPSLSSHSQSTMPKTTIDQKSLPMNHHICESD